jgi:hypothetical protein
MSWFLPLFALVLVSCTTVENDPSTNSMATLYRTRVDFMPPSRAEREQQLAYEKEFESRKAQELEDRIDRLSTERQKLYEEIAAKFPECRHQTHCLSDLTRGSTKRFEEYRDARLPLAQLDSEIAEAKAQKEKWESRYSLRVRAIYNRYLSREMLGVGKADPRIKEILVHSLEVYPDRRSLSRRILEFGAPQVEPTYLGDLDFRMLGQPVDEATVLATYMVTTTGSGKERRFLVTFLVNTHQLDPQAYEQGFLEYWAKRLGEPGQPGLRDDIYCGVYAIASPMLLAKIGPAKAKPCAPARDKLQALSSHRYLDANRPDFWFLPIAYTNL